MCIGERNPPFVSHDLSMLVQGEDPRLLPLFWIFDYRFRFNRFRLRLAADIPAYELFIYAIVPIALAGYKRRLSHEAKTRRGIADDRRDQVTTWLKGLRLHDIMFRCKLEKFSQEQRELMHMLEEYESTELLLADTDKMFKELNEEKEAHSQIIVKINKVR